MITSLVTGGAGFIGSHVVDHLLKMGHRVVILDDLSGGSRDNLPDPRGYPAKGQQWDFWNYSIVDEKAIEEIFYREAKYLGGPIDYVFHLAAYAAEGLSHYIRRYNYKTNVLGSVNLINAAVNHGVKRFVFTSSAAVYGNYGDGASEATEFVQPCDPYGIAKRAVEQDLVQAFHHFGLNYTIFRMHNVYGERQNLSDPYRNVIGIFIRQCLKNEPITIYGDGQQVRQFTYVRDIAPYIAACVESPRTLGIFNIGSAENHTINDAAHVVAHCLDTHMNVVHLPPRSEANCVSLNHDNFYRHFEAKPFASFGQGVAAMCEWAKTQTLKDPKPFTQIEIQKGLPDHWAKMANVNNH